MKCYMPISIIRKKGMINMDKYIKWQDIKASMATLTDEGKREIDLISDIISQIIERRQELGSGF